MELFCSDDVAARINASLLEQAVVNLIDNAIKYSEAGKSIGVQVESSPPEVLIQVRDEGCGIEKQHLERLFERFYRVDKARSRKLGGTGLGLAIVKHIMEAHEGRVSVESRPGRGSTFTLHLPRVSPKEPSR
jgi:two-component system phosphate regulon sensor histidine kinase PhoR